MTKGTPQRRITTTVEFPASAPPEKRFSKILAIPERVLTRALAGSEGDQQAIVIQFKESKRIAGSRGRTVGRAAMRDMRVDFSNILLSSQDTSNPNLLPFSELAPTSTSDQLELGLGEEFLQAERSQTARRADPHS